MVRSALAIYIPLTHNNSHMRYTRAWLSRRLLLTVGAVLSIIASPLAAVLPASAAAPGNYAFQNAYAIKGPCDPTDGNSKTCYFDGPTGSALPNVNKSWKNLTPISSMCGADYINQTTSGAFFRYYTKKPSSSSNCGTLSPTNDQIFGMNRTKEGIVMHQTPNGDLKPINGATSAVWKKVSVSVPGISQAYVQDAASALGGGCPSIVIQTTAGTWGVINGIRPENIPTGSSEVTSSNNYRKLTTRSDVTACYFFDTDGVRSAERSNWEQLVGSGSKYGSWTGDSYFAIWNQSNTVLGFTGKPFGLTSSVTIPEASCGGGYVWNAATKSCDKEVQPGDTNDDGGKSNCNIDGVGWLVCPIMNFLGTVLDGAFNFLAENFLQTDPKLVSTSSQTYKAWDVFRSYANVAFVIVFLIIIYSQITSAGISNYGIKRMLPRLVVAAILVNVSYFVCQLAVDVSNILGFGIVQLFNGVGVQVTSATGGGDVPSWATTIAAILIVTGAAIGILLALSVSVVLAALLAVGMVVLILIARKALIVILIVISPLAFVAYLLPNTEQWFKKWWKMFSTVLMVFPVIALVFGGSKLAATVINSPGADNLNLTRLIALGVMSIPFFAVLPLLKSSMNAVPVVGNKLQGWGNKATGRVGGKIKTTSRMGEAQRAFQARSAESRAKRRLNSKKSQWLDSGRTGRLLGGDKGSAAAAAAVSKARSEEVDNEVARMHSTWEPHEERDKAQEAYLAALKDNDIVKARAAQKVLLSKGSAGVKALRSAVEKYEADGGGVNDAVQFAKGDLSAAGIKGKDAGLNGWSYDAEQRSLSAMDSSSATYTGLTDQELAGQTDKTLERAARAGGLSVERAQGMKDNDNVWQNLNEDQRRVLDQVIAGQIQPGTPPSAGSGGGPTPTPGPSPAPGPSPTPGPNPSAQPAPLNPSAPNAAPTPPPSSSGGTPVAPPPAGSPATQPAPPNPSGVNQPFTPPQTDSSGYSGELDIHGSDDTDNGSSAFGSGSNSDDNR